MDGVTVIGNTLVEDCWSFPIKTCDLLTETSGEIFDPEYVVVPQSMARCIVRTDTNEVLGVHGSKYKAIKHDDVVNSIMDAVRDANVSKDYESKIEVFDNGAKLRGIIDFPDLVIEPDVGDIITFRVEFFNSYDSSWAFQQKAYGLRLWCKNGCWNADTVASTWAKHTLNVNVMGSAAKIQSGLDAFFNTEGRIKDWMSTAVSDDQAEYFLKHAICRVPNKTSTFKWNERQLDNLMGQWYAEKRQLGSNKWALYNALTYWATHTDETSAPANAQRLRSNAVVKAMKTNQWVELI